MWLMLFLRLMWKSWFVNNGCWRVFGLIYRFVKTFIYCWPGELSELLLVFLLFLNCKENGNFISKGNGF